MVVRESPGSRGVDGAIRLDDDERRRPRRALEATDCSTGDGTDDDRRGEEAGAELVGTLVAELERSWPAALPPPAFVRTGEGVSASTRRLASSCVDRGDEAVEGDPPPTPSLELLGVAEATSSGSEVARRAMPTVARGDDEDGASLSRSRCLSAARSKSCLSVSGFDKGEGGEWRDDDDDDLTAMGEVPPFGADLPDVPRLDDFGEVPESDDRRRLKARFNEKLR